MKDINQFLQKTVFPFILATLAIINTSTGQVNVEDSLKQILNKTTVDSSKAKILVQLARSANHIDREKSIKYYSEALQFEEDKYSRALILDTIGLFNWQLGNYNESIEYFKEALLLFTDLKDSIWLGKVNNNIAVVSWGLGHSNEAMEYYLIALKIRRAINDEKGVSTILNNIGLVYQGWGLYDEAFKRHNDALSIALNLEDFAAIAYSYINVGICHENKKEYKTALENYNLGYKNLLMKEENYRSISFFLINIGRVYNKMGDMDSALSNFKESLIQAKRINNNNRIAIAQYNLGKIYLEINEIDSASNYVNSSFEISLQNNYNGLIRDNQFVLAEIEEKRGNVSEALKYLKSATALKDSIFNKEKITRFTDLQIRYNRELVSQENILLRSNIKIQELAIHEQKIIRSILIISGLLILVILIFISRSRNSIKKLNVKLEKAEKDLLELNATKDKFFTIIAHDLKSPFNGLLGLTEMLDEDYDQLSAEKIKEIILLLKKSSSNVYALLEGLLQWAQIQTGKIEYQIENIDIFKNSVRVIELLNINADSKRITLENRVKENTFVFADVKASSSILRNLISNAIKFTKPGGVIKVETENRGGEIAISVSDNGVGMSEAQLKKLFSITEKISEPGTENEMGTGLGLILCKELVEKNNGKIWVESELGKGSRFIFTLPKGKL